MPTLAPTFGSLVRAWLFGACTMCLLSTARATQEMPPFFSVIQATAPVKAQVQGKSRTLILGDTVAPGAILETGPGETLTIITAQRETIGLSGNTKVQLISNITASGESPFPNPFTVLIFKGQVEVKTDASSTDHKEIMVSTPQGLFSSAQADFLVKELIVDQSECIGGIQVIVGKVKGQLSSGEEVDINQGHYLAAIGSGTELNQQIGAGLLPDLVSFNPAEKERKWIQSSPTFPEATQPSENGLSSDLNSTVDPQILTKEELTIPPSVNTPTMVTTAANVSLVNDSVIPVGTAASIQSSIKSVVLDEVPVNYSINLDSATDEQFDTFEILHPSQSLSLSYPLWTKLSFGLSLNSGLLVFQNQTTAFTLTPTAKLTYDLDAKTKITSDISRSYTDADTISNSSQNQSIDFGTSYQATQDLNFQVDASQSQQMSEAIMGPVTTDNALMARCGFNIGKNLGFNLGLTFENVEDYPGGVSGSVKQIDDYYAASPGLTYTPTADCKIGLNYVHRENFSNNDGDILAENQFTLSTSLSF